MLQAFSFRGGKGRVGWVADCFGAKEEVFVLGLVFGQLKCWLPLLWEKIFGPNRSNRRKKR